MSAHQITSPSRLNEIANRARLEVLADAFKIRAGCLPAGAAHPDARELLAQDQDHGILFEAAVLGAIGGAHEGWKGTPDQAFARGWSTSDFSGFLATSLQDVVFHRHAQHAEHRAICSERPAKNYMLASFPSLAFGGEIEEVPENSEVTGYSMAESAGLSAKLKTYGTALVVSRKAIQNDSVEAIAEAFGSVGTALARKEARACYELIESNPTLADSEPMFHADHGNLLTDVLSVASLGTAMQRLRDNPTPAGEPADLPAHVLLVNSSLELTAINLLAEAKRSEQIKLVVVASPHITAGRWYLFADPNQAPVIGRMTLHGASGPRVGQSNRLKNIKTERIEGLAMAVFHDFNFVPLGRVGVVRGGL